MGRFLTRPERLAELRKRKRAEAAAEPVTLNPRYPYRALRFDPALYGALRVTVKKVE